eukprot:TRINITY_DN27803_c0_g1_i2.p1 TRINITY_DN27803_c0_g1~~TRINITY_DN27803_c0_g1_i2.p1  ORF type:complete len:338 (-),score=34.83 TRINITY_DN27803_c0_g1_i2:6-1019(-)
MQGDGRLRRQSSLDFDDEVEGEWWPPPLSAQDVAIRQRAVRLLESLRRIPSVYYDLKAWENQHESTFGLFRKGCLDASNCGMLEAPIYSNRQIEDAWLFLLEMRRRHFNRRKHIQECARILGASYNWSIVLIGSRKIHESLRELPYDICMEILQDANAIDLLSTLGLVREDLHNGSMRDHFDRSVPFSYNGDAGRDVWPSRNEVQRDTDKTDARRNPFVSQACIDWAGLQPDLPPPSRVGAYSGNGFAFADQQELPQIRSPTYGRSETNPFRREGAQSKNGNPFHAASNRGVSQKSSSPNDHRFMDSTGPGGLPVNYVAPQSANGFPEWAPVRQAVR